MTGNVTWLSPAACDPGQQAVYMPRGPTKRAGQAMRVLVTEDDEVLAMALAAGLRREGMAVDVALDGAAALEHLAVNRYDVVVLDRDLPACTATTSAGPGRGQIRDPGADAYRGQVWSGTGSRASGWAPMTTCRSRSISRSSWPASGPWAGAPPAAARQPRTR